MRATLIDTVTMPYKLYGELADLISCGPPEKWQNSLGGRGWQAFLKHAQFAGPEVTPVKPQLQPTFRRHHKGVAGAGRLPSLLASGMEYHAKTWAGPFASERLSNTLPVP
jgi:hypothetical protein